VRGKKTQTHKHKQRTNASKKKEKKNKKTNKQQFQANLKKVGAAKKENSAHLYKTRGGKRELSGKERKKLEATD